MPRARPRASSSSIKNDAGSRLARLLEQVAHPGGTDTHEHFDELGAVGRIECNTRLTCHCPRQQRLASTWRTDQQDAAWNVSPEPREFLWVFEEIHDLTQLLLGFIDTRDIVERHVYVGLGNQFCLAAASGEQSAAQAASHHPAGSEPPDTEKDQRRHDPRQQHADAAAGRRAAVQDAAPGQLGGQVRSNAIGPE